jgi:hypothetical protein
MKKSLLLASLIAAVALAACGKKEEAAVEAASEVALKLLLWKPLLKLLPLPPTQLLLLPTPLRLLLTLLPQSSKPLLKLLPL